MPPQAARPNRGTASGAPQFIGDYALTEELPRSLLADAFAAVHMPSGSARALYVLRPMAMQDEGVVARAAAEIDAARRARHPALPTVDPHGETPDGRLYFAVERRAGETLGALVAQQGRLDATLVARVASRVADALHAIHTVGMVHGHLGPESILLGGPDPRGHVDVSLLGLATTILTGGVIEVDDYVYFSPERVQRTPLDARADVFSLASVLRFALDGDAPPTVPGRRSPRDAWAAVDASLDRQSSAGVLAYARSANPDLRPSTAQGFARELLAALVREGRIDGASIFGEPTPSAPAPTAVPAAEVVDVRPPAPVADARPVALDEPVVSEPAEPAAPVIVAAAVAATAVAAHADAAESPTVESLAPTPQVAPVVEVPAAAVEVPSVQAAPVASEPVVEERAVVEPAVVEAPVIAAPVVEEPVAEAPAAVVDVPSVEAAPVEAEFVAEPPVAEAPVVVVPRGEEPPPSIVARAPEVPAFLVSQPSRAAAAPVVEPVPVAPREMATQELQVPELTLQAAVLPAVVLPEPIAPVPVAERSLPESRTTGAITAPVAAPRPRGRRRAMIGLAAVGVLGASGLAAAFNRSPSASPTSEAERPSTAPVAAAAAPVPTDSATTPAAAVAAPMAAPIAAPAAALPDTATTKPAAAVPTLPRLAAVGVPTINVGPTEPSRRDVVKADEFARIAPRDGAEASGAGDAAVTPAAARQEAERAVHAVASAIGARDIAALQRAVPRMPAETRARWASLFREAIRVRADLVVTDVQIDHGVIAARVRNQITVFHVGAAPERTDGIWVALLSRDSTGWRLSTAP